MLFLQTTLKISRRNQIHLKHIKFQKKGQNHCTLLYSPIPPFPLPPITPFIPFLLPLCCYPLFVLSSFSLSFLSCHFYPHSISVSSSLHLLSRLSSTFSVYMYVNLTGSFKNILLTTLAVYIFPLNILGGSKLSSKRCFMGKEGG
jgi:hypothetical protein